MTLRGIKIFLMVLPRFLELVRTIEETYTDAQLDQKIKEDLGAINEAFKNKDAAALNRIFNS